MSDRPEEFKREDELVIEDKTENSKEEKRQENLLIRVGIIVALFGVFATFLVFFFDKWSDYCSDQIIKQNLLDSYKIEIKKNNVTVSLWEKNKDRLLEVKTEWFIDRFDTSVSNVFITSGKIRDYSLIENITDTYIFMNRANRRLDSIQDLAINKDVVFIEKKEEYVRSVSYDINVVKGNLFLISQRLMNLRYYPNTFCPS